MEQAWVDKIKMGALGTAEAMAKGFHAIPKPDANPFKEMPSMHRLLNVVGMVGGFAGVQYLSNIIFGCKINGSHCEEIPKEKVPKPLRFLHGIVEYNPFSDAPRDQWLKVLHQMLPAMGGAMGAIKGSEVFFHDFNKRERDFNKWMDVKKSPTLNPIQADSAASFAQGKEWRKLAGMSAWVSSASGLTALYGVALNAAFMTCNGAKVAGFKWLRHLTGNPSKLGFGAEKGMAEVLKGMEMAMRDGNSEGFARQLMETGVAPLVKLTPEREKAIVKRLKETFEVNAWQVEDKKKEIPQLAEYMRKKVMEIIAETDIGELNVGNNGIVTFPVAKMKGYADQLQSITSRIEHPVLARVAPSHLSLKVGKEMAEVIGDMATTMQEGHTDHFTQQVIKSGVASLAKLHPDQEQQLAEHLAPIFNSDAMKAAKPEQVPALIEYVRRHTLESLYNTKLHDPSPESAAAFANVEKSFPGLGTKIKEMSSVIGFRPDLFTPDRGRGV